MAGMNNPGSRNQSPGPGRRMLVIGVVLALLSPLAGMGLGAAGLVKAANQTSREPRYQPDQVNAVDLNAGSNYSIWQISPIDPGSGAVTLDCRVSGPDGAAVAVKVATESPAASARVTGSGANEYWRTVASFTPDRTGPHELTCTGADPSAKIIITPPLPTSVMALVIGGLTLGLLGFLTGLGLIITHFIRRRRYSQHR